MFLKLKKLLKINTAKNEESEKKQPAAGSDCGVSDASDKTAFMKNDNSVKEPVKTPAVLKGEKNRKGIRVFNKSDDIESFFESEFTSEDDNDRYEPVEIQPARLELPERKTENKRFSKKIIKNRKGFLVLDDLDDKDLFKDFELNESVESTSPVKKEPLKETDSEKEVFKRKNRHGINILPDSGSDTLYETSENEFVRLLNQNLGYKTRDTLMNEKGVRPGRKKPLSLKEKLERYPHPKRQLDLHGYTSVRAELRAESFIKSAYIDQVNTVIVIVGRGLHSEDGAVLPDVVRTLLDRLRSDGVVLSYKWDNEKQSRSGAVIVYLNNLDFD